MGSEDRKRILIVEDDDDLRIALELLLKDEGFEVLGAQQGSVALQIVEETAPDAILLDLNMPEMDGEDFAHAFRSKYGNDVPILIYTALPRPRVEERISNAKLLRKPVESDDLLEELHRSTRSA